jgi:hypothetical protein
MKVTVFNEGGGGSRRGAFSVLVGKSEGKSVREGVDRGGRGNIKIKLQEVEWGSWTGLIWLLIGTGSVLV